MTAIRKYYGEGMFFPISDSADVRVGCEASKTTCYPFCRFRIHPNTLSLGCQAPPAPAIVGLFIPWPRWNIDKYGSIVMLESKPRAHSVIVRSYQRALKNDGATIWCVGRTSFTSACLIPLINHHIMTESPRSLWFGSVIARVSFASRVIGLNLDRGVYVLLASSEQLPAIMPCAMPF
ncbi:hypothetical protein BC826DRAFT_49249 [Russula brevipes]|nr:hypothetical protein BC826DRAFT_49249 [Russula brevipes]